MEERVLVDLLDALQDLEEMTDVELDASLAVSNTDPVFVQSCLERAAQIFGLAFTRQHSRRNS